MSIRKNVGALLTSNFSSILLQLMTVPVLLLAWGVDLYASWIVLSTVPGFLIYSDIGISAVSNNRMDFYSAVENHAGAKTVFVTAASILALIILLVCIVGFLLYIFLLSLESRVVQEINLLALIFLVVDSLVSVVHNFCSGIFRCVHLYHRTINWQTLGRILSIGCMLLSVVLFDCKITEAALVQFVCRVLVFFVMLFDMHYKCGVVLRENGSFSMIEARQVVQPTLSFMLLPISNMILLQVMTLIVAAFSTAKVLTEYNTLRTMSRFAPQFVGIVGRARWSIISKLSVSDSSNIVAIRGNIFKQTILATLIVVSVYFLLGRYIYEFWTAGELSFDWVLFSVLMFYSGATSVYTALEVVPLASNNVKEYAAYFLMGAIIAAGVSYLTLIIFPKLDAGVVSAGCAGVFSAVIAIYLTKKYYTGVFGGSG